jgi:hypothetical protein
MKDKYVMFIERVTLRCNNEDCIHCCQYESINNIITNYCQLKHISIDEKGSCVFNTVNDEDEK